jgi:prepilin-type N-terminal cleavage/methylation domain-containing protein
VCQKQERAMKKINSGFAFIEILVVLAIIAFILLKAAGNYYEKPSMDKKTQKMISAQGIDTTSYSAVKDSIKNKLENIKYNRKYYELDKIK